LADKPTTNPEAPAETVSAWSPFKNPVFRALWIATVVSNVGTWMQSVGAAWFMTSLSKSPVLVALVQVATTLPMFLFSLPAGALADIVDRRRLLLFTQAWMTAAAAVLGVLTLAGLTTPWVLLTFTFLLGLGASLNGPAWMAIVPELVPRRHLLQASQPVSQSKLPPLRHPRRHPARRPLPRRPPRRRATAPPAKSA